MRPNCGRGFLLFEKHGASINLHTKKNIWLFPSVDTLIELEIRGHDTYPPEFLQ
jgi:hypothetical protein